MRMLHNEQRISSELVSYLIGLMDISIQLYIFQYTISIIQTYQMKLYI